jgi:hypothetical protein
MDKGTPQTHPPEGYKVPPKRSEIQQLQDLIDSYRRDRESDRKSIANLQERIAELEKERDLMLFKAKVQFNVFWNGGWHQMPMPIKPTEGSE